MALRYQKGDYISYSYNGVCLVEDVIKMNSPLDSGQRDFYILRPVSEPVSKIFVPVNNEALTAKMRNILSKREVDYLIDFIKERGVVWIQDRNERLNSFQSIIQQCDQQALLQLVSCIYIQKQQLAKNKKTLPSSDEIILRKAEKLIENEFAFVLNVSQAEVGPYIRGRLEVAGAIDDQQS